jgi:hypothetical protein
MLKMKLTMVSCIIFSATLISFQARAALVSSGVTGHGSDTLTISAQTNHEEFWVLLASASWRIGGETARYA